MKRLVPLIAAVLLASGCSSDIETPLPSSILMLDLAETLSGEEAAGIINHLHDSEVASAENYVGRYHGAGLSATYYLSVYETGDEAHAELDAMVAGMERGGHVFDHVRRRTVNERDVWMALGMGQAHYFYSQDNRLIWLAVDVPIAEDAIESLL
jgi:hypothetical protein